MNFLLVRHVFDGVHYVPMDVPVRLSEVLPGDENAFFFKCVADYGWKVGSGVVRDVVIYVNPDNLRFMGVDSDLVRGGSSCT